MMKDLDYYRQLPYTRRAVPVVEGEERPYWLARIDEIPGCKADGASEVEAMANLDAAFDDYVTAMLKWGSPIPEPSRRPQLTQTVSFMVSPVVTIVRLADRTELYRNAMRARAGSSFAPTPPPAADVERLNAAETVEVG